MHAYSLFTSEYVIAPSPFHRSALWFWHLPRLPRALSPLLSIFHSVSRCTSSIAYPSTPHWWMCSLFPTHHYQKLCLILCNFITCVAPCRYWYHLISTVSSQGSLMLTLYRHITLPSPPSETLSNHQFVLYLYNFTIPRMVYKWNHTVRYILRFSFSLSVIPLTIIQSVASINRWLPFYGWVVFHRMDVPLFV